MNRSGSLLIGLSSLLLLGCGSDDPAGDKVDAGKVDRPDANKTPPPCVPIDCAGLGFTCGPAEDGCGAALDCGTCTDQTCVSGTCVTLDCGANPKNACDGCEVLADSVGGSCNCETLVLACNDRGTLSCDDGNTAAVPVVLDPTDDDVDTFSEIVATLSAAPGDDLDYDYDEYSVVVTDENFSVLDLTMEIDYTLAGEATLQIVYDIDSPDASPLLNCESGEQSDTKEGKCRLIIPAGTGTFNVDTSINYGAWDPSDDSGTWKFIIQQSGEAVAGDCDTYKLRYHF